VLVIADSLFGRDAESLAHHRGEDYDLDPAVYSFGDPDLGRDDALIVALATLRLEPAGMPDRLWFRSAWLTNWLAAARGTPGLSRDRTVGQPARPSTAGWRRAHPGLDLRAASCVTRQRGPDGGQCSLRSCCCCPQIARTDESNAACIDKDGHGLCRTARPHR
jgi:hypothetical protein